MNTTNTEPQNIKRIFIELGSQFSIKLQNAPPEERTPAAILKASEILKQKIKRRLQDEVSMEEIVEYATQMLTNEALECAAMLSVKMMMKGM